MEKAVCTKKGTSIVWDVSISRSDMNEAEIRNHFIDPALDSSGWDMHHRRLEFTLTAGRIVNQDGAWNRGEGSEADYILMPSPDFHIGVVEAKDGHYGPDEGLQQALDYANLLDLPFAASSNGEGVAAVPPMAKSQAGNDTSPEAAPAKVHPPLAVC